MIEKCLSYKTSDGTIYETIEAAQAGELSAFLADKKATAMNEDDFAEMLVAHKDRVIDILTMTATSRPKARKANRAKKRAAKVATAELPLNPPAQA